MSNKFVLMRRPQVSAEQEARLFPSPEAKTPKPLIEVLESPGPGGDRKSSPPLAVSVLPPKGGVKQTQRSKMASSRRARGRRSRKVVPSLPPALHVVPVVEHTFRFINTSTVAFSASANITRASLCGALGGICTVANTTIRPFAGSARIISITVWPAAGGTAGIFWTAGGTAEGALSRDDAISEDTPTGITVEPRPLCFRPPAGSFQSMWQALNTNSTDVLFQYYGTSGSVWDLHVVFTLAANASGPSVTISSGTLGQQYYLALDGPSVHNLVPQGLPYTF